MSLRPVRFAIGFAITPIFALTEPPTNAETDAKAGATSRESAPASPLHEYLRESLKAKLPANPPQASASANPNSASTTKTDANPIVMPTFVVKESRDKAEKRASQIVDGQKAMEDRLSYHPLFKTERLEILRRPRMDDLPTHNGMDRLKVDIFNLKW